MNKKRRYWAFELYLSSDDYVDTANKTIGKPGLTTEVLVNRRHVTKELSDEGQRKLGRVDKIIEILVGQYPKWEFSKYCGCNMCPCSPGYKGYIETTSEFRSDEDDRMSIHFDEYGGVVFGTPKDGHRLSLAIAKQGK
jgi:hypothetical protein